LQVVRLGGTPMPRTSLLAKALRGILFFVGSLCWCLRFGRRGQKVLIASNPPFIGLLGPILRFWGFSYVFIFQDLFPRSAVLTGVLPAAGPLTWCWQTLMTLVCRQSSRTVVLSEAMEQRLVREFGSDLPVSLIHNWAVEAALPLPRAQNPFAKELGLESFFTVQYSGNFGRLHDLLTLLEAARLLECEPIRFLFIGDGAKVRQIEAYRTGLGLRNVIQLPYQPREKLPESLGACDLAAIGLIPGAEDTVAPCKFYGILASGRPVLLVARRTCDLAKLVLAENCGLVVEPGEAALLADALRVLQLDKPLVEAMGARSLALYRNRFGIKRSLAAYQALLQ
jgi:glycosyltransferase involved in cell wall biosynthesis